MGVLDSAAVSDNDSVGVGLCFEEANMGMKSPSSSSCVLLLGSALFVNVGRCDVSGSGGVSEEVDLEVDGLELHNQPMVMRLLLVSRGEIVQI